MTTLTIRIENNLKKQAAKQAQVLGVPLTLIVKNALKNFIEAPRIIIGEPETVIVGRQIQQKMDKIGRLLSKNA